MRHLIFRLALATICAGYTVTSPAQDGSTIDLLNLIKPDAHARNGDWSRSDGTVSARANGTQAMCVVPYEVTGRYQLSVELSRKTGSEMVGVILPLEKTQVLLELSGWNGASHGLSRINRSPTNSDKNPTSVRPGALENGERHLVEVSVVPSTDSVSISVTLNGETIINWNGNYSDIEPNLAYNIPDNRRPVLVTHNSDATFHSLKMTHEKGKGKSIELSSTSLPARTPLANPFPDAELTSVPREGGQVELSNLIWTDAIGSLDLVRFKNQEVVRIRGRDDSVALLPGSEMDDGIIEVDIASDTFSGIAVRASDVRNYDLLYFRPQNSGTSKHENTVQYVCKGKDGADWRSLRNEFPGKYEAGAAIGMNQWFHVKIVLKGKKLTAYVDDQNEPALVIEQMLGERPSGRIGLWGWQTHFRNFSFKPR